jgi:SHS2 domain-containing protein
MQTTIAVDKGVKQLLDELRAVLGAKNYNELLKKMVDKLIFTDVSLRALKEKRVAELSKEELKQLIKALIDEDTLIFDAQRVLKRGGAYAGKEFSADIERLPPDTPKEEVELLAALWHARIKNRNKLAEALREYVRREYS